MKFTKLMAVALFGCHLAGAYAAPAAETPALPVPDAADRIPAPAFEMPDMDGKKHTLQDFAGKVVVLNFWATWCPPCREEMPSMERARQALKDDPVELVAVNVGEDVDTIFTFTADYPVEFLILLDQDAKVIEDYPVTGLPTTYVIDPQGRIVYRAVGSREWDDPAILQALRDLAKPAADH